MSEEVDYNYAFAPLPFVWSLTNAAANTYTAVDVKLDNNAKKNALTEEIQRIIGSGFEVIEKEALNPCTLQNVANRAHCYLFNSFPCAYNRLVQCGWCHCDDGFGQAQSASNAAGNGFISQRNTPDFLLSRSAAQW